MDWVRKLFAQHKVFEQPTAGGYEATYRRLRARDAKMKEDILKAGGGTLGPYSNVAVWSAGGAMLEMEKGGLLQSERVNGDPHVTKRFTLTETGRAAAAMLTDDVIA